MLLDTLKISDEFQTDTFRSKMWTSDQVSGDIQMISTDCNGHRNIPWEWVNLSQAKSTNYLSSDVWFLCFYLDTFWELHFSEKEEIMMLWLFEKKQYFKFVFKVEGHDDKV